MPCAPAGACRSTTDCGTSEPCSALLSRRLTRTRASAHFWRNVTHNSWGGERLGVGPPSGQGIVPVLDDLAVSHAEGVVPKEVVRLRRIVGMFSLTFEHPLDE